MKQELKHLPDSELEVMLAVWNSGEKVHTGEIVECLKDNGWQTSTIQNLLSRLCDKGFLSCEKVGRLNYYTPLIAEEEYRSRETASFLKKLHRNSAASLMTALVNSVDLSDEEIRELKSILDKGGEIMLNALFEKMLQVSAVLSVAAVLYVLFRPLIRKYFSAAAEYALIALVMLRGLIPFNYALTLPAAPAPVVQEKVPAAVNPMMFTPFKNTDIPPPIVAVPEQEFFSVEKFLSAVAEALPYIWLAGIVAVLAVNAVRHLWTLRALKRNTETVYDREILEVFGKTKTDLNVTKWIEIRRGECIRTPMLCGFRRTVLYIPVTDFTAEQLGTIFRHELTHYVRGDLWGKLFFLMGKAVHWYNPLVWLLAKMAEFNMELACDNEVLKGKTNDFRRNYGYMILQVAVSARKQDVLTTKFYGGKRQMKKRFENIAEQRNFHSGKTLLIMGLMIILGAGLFIGCEREVPNEVLPQNTAVTTTAETTAEAVTVPDVSVPVHPGNIVDTQLSDGSERDDAEYYRSMVDGSAFSGEITDLTDSKITVYFAGKGDTNTFNYTKDTIIDVPGGLAVGKNVTVIYVDDYSGGFTAKTIMQFFSVEYEGEKIWASPPTNIKAISEEFGEDDYGRSHQGIDMTATDGDKGLIFAAASGTVILSEWYSGYGNAVFIDVDGQPGYTLRYAHCSKILVKAGDEVKRGQVIGKIGNTGNSVGPHLHFEVNDNGKFIDPAPYLGGTFEVQSLMEQDIASFVEAYFSNDLETVKFCLSPISSINAEAYGKDVWDTLENTEYKFYNDESGRSLCSFRFNLPGEDSYTYLSMHLKYDGGRWYIFSYGLEK